MGPREIREAQRGFVERIEESDFQEKDPAPV
jgi:hypothetical protein